MMKRALLVVLIGWPVCVVLQLTWLVVAPEQWLSVWVLLAGLRHKLSVPLNIGSLMYSSAGHHVMFFAFVVIPVSILLPMRVLLILILKRNDPDWLMRPRWKNWPNPPW